MSSGTAKRGAGATIPRAETGVVGPPFCSSKQGSGNRGLATQNWCCGTPSAGVVGPPFRAETGVWEHHEQVQGKNNRVIEERERPAASRSRSRRMMAFASLGKKESKQAPPSAAESKHRLRRQQEARRRSMMGAALCPTARPCQAPGRKTGPCRGYQEAQHHPGHLPRWKTPAPVPGTALRTELPAAVGQSARTAEGCGERQRQSSPRTSQTRCRSEQGKGPRGRDRSRGGRRGQVGRGVTAATAEAAAERNLRRTTGIT
jgi:hypothetical protein